MIMYLLTCMEEKKNAQVHLLFAISWLEAAWVGVSSSTIKNCFSHSGFVMDEAMEEVVEEEMNRCFEALKKHQAIDVNYIDFLEVDKDVQVAGEQSIEEIVKEVMGKEEDEEVEPTEKDLNKTSITPAAAVDAFNTIKTLCYLKDISEEERHAYSGSSSLQHFPRIGLSAWNNLPLNTTSMAKLSKEIPFQLILLSNPHRQCLELLDTSLY
ncbi:TIGD3 [Cordylochernes scorpioides]|uniref:TIGD3 n=1 Tax=Cordylochernes scorpioides TaxID=51811 RepID=A0ABY6L5F7_9ARAC|nr:TIGD3 [Cordylochernes scorpioides]